VVVCVHKKKLGIFVRVLVGLAAHAGFAWAGEATETPRTAREGAAGEKSGSENAPTAAAAAPVDALAITAPVPVDTSVQYPPDGEGDSIVILEFVVAVDGKVRDVEVTLGDEPFAAAAIASAQAWKFQPARRGDRAIAARIAFEVRFEMQQPPQPAVNAQPGKQPLEAAPPVPHAAAASTPVVDVIVEGERPVLATRLTRAEARQVPGGLGDPLRAVEVLPGVSPIVSGLPLFYVRGAPPGNIGYFVDDVRVPFLYHAFLGPSVIHPELMEQVTLYPGPYPSQYGEFAGGIVVAELRNPRQRLSFGGELGLFDVGGFAEVPFASGKGTIFAAGRYSYSALLAQSLSSVKADFWNYQAFGQYQLTSRDKLGVLAMGAYDLAEREGGYEFAFHRVDLRYEHAFSADTHARIAAGFGVDSTHLVDGRVLDHVFSGRVNLSHRFSDRALLRAGANLSNDDFDVEVNSASIDSEKLLQLFTSRTDGTLGGFASLDWKPEGWLQVTPGVRVTRFQSGSQARLGVDPSVVARFRISNDVALVHGVGVAHQTPNYIPNVPGARVAGLSGGLQRAVFASSGVEVALPYEIQGTASVFDNVIFDVTDPFSSTQDFAINPEAAKERPTAHAYGLELKLHRPLTRRFGGMLSYTLSRSTRTYDNYSTLAGSDRTHVLNLAGLYTLGANWRVGGRAVAYSGVPGRLEGARRIFDQSRSHPFLRADLRLERRFRIGPDSYWSVVGEVQNATLSQEVLRRVCSRPQQNAEPECKDTVVGPVFLPNLKIEARF
jgi:TonB family protein